MWNIFSTTKLLFSLPELSPICETAGGPTCRRGSMDYFSSRLTSSSRGSVKVDIEEAVGTDEQVEESEEARLRQTVDVPVEAVEQVLTYLFWVLVFLFPIKSYDQAQLKKRGHRRGTSDTSTIDFRLIAAFSLSNSLKMFQRERRGWDGQQRHHRKLDPGSSDFLCSQVDWIAHCCIWCSPECARVTFANTIYPKQGHNIRVILFDKICI